MSEVLLLLKTQLYNYFSLNELFHPQQKKQSTVAITAVGIITLLAFLSGYNALTAMALVNMGQQALIPTYMVSVSSFLTLIFTLLRSNGILLGSRDFEMLSALPIKTKKILLMQML
jgi:ABC-2 type transport system permease protein